MVEIVALGKELKAVILDAVEAVDNARQKCMAAGHALNEAQSKLAHPRGNQGRFKEGDDGFLEWLSKAVPEISTRTAQYWMEAARNILKALPPISGPGNKADGYSYIDVEGIPVSEVLSRREADLPASVRAWRQTWLDFTADKTIKQCVAGVFLDDDAQASRRLLNAINGKTSHRAGGGGDRKDYPTFITRKLRQITGHVVTRKNRHSPASWREIDADQRSKICLSFDLAISTWPKWLLEIVEASAKRELRLSDVHRVESLAKNM